MRSPSRRRPRIREIFVPQDADLDAVAIRARYVGSAEHKDIPSFAGQPRPRGDASLCPRTLGTERRRITGWLRDAIRNGLTGAPWEGPQPGFPRYVWYKYRDTVFEGRLVNCVLGEYKGYPLEKSEWPSVFRGIDAKS